LISRENFIGIRVAFLRYKENADMKAYRPILGIAAILASAALLVLPGSAATKKKGDKNQKKSGPASSALDAYLKRVDAAGVPHPTTPGSLWVDAGPLASVSADYKARRLGDLVIVRLVDKFTADTSGENKNSRDFAGQSGVTGLVGQIGTQNRLQNLFGGSSSNSLDDKGASTMSSDLQLSLAGQVVQVLPNGVLVVEAARDFTVGNDRQTVVLRGLVRPGDLGPDNSVLSSEITNLELEIRGKGAVADATRRPNPIVRFILKFLSF
jgi:flagellar L-ring protein FlgH